MKTNMAQIRATNALNWKDKKYGGKNEGNVVSGFPVIIRIDGLLAALAYAVEKKEDKQTKRLIPKNEGEFVIALAIFNHLTTTLILKDEPSIRQFKEKIAALAGHNQNMGEQFFEAAEGFTRELASGDSALLRRATAEALAFLNYLKRFVA